MTHCSFVTIKFFLAPWCWPSHSHIRAGVSSIFNHSPPPIWKNKQKWKWKSSKWIFDPQVHLWRHGRPCHRDGIWRTPSCRGAPHPPSSHNPLKICPTLSCSGDLFLCLAQQRARGDPGHEVVDHVWILLPQWLKLLLNENHVCEMFAPGAWRTPWRACPTWAPPSPVSARLDLCPSSSASWSLWW